MDDLPILGHIVNKSVKRLHFQDWTVYTNPYWFFLLIQYWYLMQLSLLSFDTFPCSLLCRVPGLDWSAIIFLLSRHQFELLPSCWLFSESVLPIIEECVLSLTITVILPKIQILIQIWSFLRQFLTLVYQNQTCKLINRIWCQKYISLLLHPTRKMRASWT